MTIRTGSTTEARVKQADLASIVGVAMHAWGMAERHRLDAGALRLWWAEAIYWCCWVTLAALIVLAIVRR